jgi:hypothetical protein
VPADPLLPALRRQREDRRAGKDQRSRTRLERAGLRAWARPGAEVVGAEGSPRGQPVSRPQVAGSRVARPASARSAPDASEQRLEG